VVVRWETATMHVALLGKWCGGTGGKPGRLREIEREACGQPTGRPVPHTRSRARCAPQPPHHHAHTHTHTHTHTEKRLSFVPYIHYGLRILSAEPGLAPDVFFVLNSRHDDVDTMAAAAPTPRVPHSGADSRPSGACSAERRDASRLALPHRLHQSLQPTVPVPTERTVATSFSCQ
jgi:hypothetical protein